MRSYSPACCWYLRLEAKGLTLEEAALIQPTYCGTAARICVCNVAAQGMLVRGVADETGSNITVEDLYGTLGVKVGDVLPLEHSAQVAPNDIVFAHVVSKGTDAGLAAHAQFTAQSETDSVDVSSQCYWGVTPPGSLPYALVNEALFSKNADTCSQILVAHDPAWGEAAGMDCGPQQPESSTGGNDSSGCSISAGGRGGECAKPRESKYLIRLFNFYEYGENGVENLQSLG